MMQVQTPLSEAIGRYLDLTTQQLQLTASNMANVDTPGFKSEGLNFNQAFSDALAGHAQKGAAEVEDLVTRPDGNNVSMDREAMELAKEQLQFRTGVELLKHEFSRISDAIHSESK